MNKNKISPLKLFLALTLPVLFIFTFILFSGITIAIFNEKDSYLITGFTFFIYVSILMSVLPFIIISLSSNKKKINIKSYFKKYPKLMSIYLIIYLGILSIFLYQASIYLKDIIINPKTSYIENVTVKRVYNKQSTSYYLEGNLNGKKTSLKVIREAKDNIKRGKKYKKLKIDYYENLKEVFKIY